MSERDEFGRILASLQRAVFDDAHWARTSALVDEACGAKGDMLVFGDGRSRDDIRIFVARCLYRGERHGEIEREYFDVYHALDERVPRLRSLPDSRIVHVTDLYTDAELKTSAAYNEALRRAHGQNGLNVRLDGPHGSRIVWVVGDPVDGDGWSSRRVDMIRRFLPHLRHYVNVRQALAESGALGASLTGLLEQSGIGIVQLDGRGRIVAANDPARALLWEGDGLFDEDGFLRARPPDADAVLRGLLAQALPRSGEQGAGGSMVVRRSTHRLGLVLHLSPVGDGHADFGAAHVAALVLVVDPEARTRVDPALVEAALGLKPMESRVAALLAEGRTVRDIVAATGRSENTIRWYVKQTYDKCGVSRQVDLVRLVLSVTGPLGRG